MKLFSWPLAPLAMILLAISLFALPTKLEGPVLLPIGPGHALSVLDSFALPPLLAGLVWLYAGLWHSRARLYESIRQAPGVSSVAVFTAGFGFGLLLASSFSSFFWWWAIGAFFFSAMLITALIVVARR